MKQSISIIILSLVTLIMVACGQSESVQCPDASAETLLLRSDKAGYCLLYPNQYTIESPSEEQTVLVVGSLLNVEEPRLSIEVHEAAGKSASQMADELVASIQAELPGFEIKRSTITLAGEEGVVLDNMPGQDISRQIIVRHNGRSYQLTFVPASQDAGEAYTKMESLYKTVTDSFHFLNDAS